MYASLQASDGVRGVADEVEPIRGRAVAAGFGRQLRAGLGEFLFEEDGVLLEDLGVQLVLLGEGEVDGDVAVAEARESVVDVVVHLVVD